MDSSPALGFVIVLAMTQYLEVVTDDLDTTCAMYAALFDVSFGEPVADLGGARTATRSDGTVIGIRTPLADHEAPIVRSYLAVDDVEAAAKAAEANGGMVAYAPTKQGDYGTFAIIIAGGVQHGLWQR